MGSSKNGLLRTMPQIFVLFLVLAVLGITIALLVIIINVQDQSNNIYSKISVPQAMTANELLNIPVAPKVSSSDPNKYTAYSRAAQEFRYSVNLTADPCNDFYNYACGNYDKAVSISDMMDSNYNSMLTQLTSPSYQITVQNSSALTKEKQFFEACVAVLGNAGLNNQTLVENNYLMGKVSQLQKLIGSNFTTVFGGTATKPSPTELGNALGYLSFEQGIDTYVTPMVDTYWVDNSKGYQFFVDQNTAEMSKTYYSPSAFATVKQGYIDRTTATLGKFCREQNAACPDLQNKVTKLIEFEQLIAYNYSTDDTTRRQYKRSWNNMTISDMQNEYPFVDWSAYVTNAPGLVRDKLNSKDAITIVMETDMTKKLSNDLPKMDAELVVNYLFMRLVLDSSQYLPSYASVYAKMPKTSESFKIGRDRSDRRQVRSRRSFMSSAVDHDTGMQCIQMVDDLMTYSNGRVFIDNIYPDDQSKQDIRRTAGGLIKNVVNSFQGMLEQLDWMDDDTRVKALQKTNGIIKNIAFPDWILNNTLLDNYYTNLTFTDKDNFYSMWDSLIKFNIFLQYQQLTLPTADRHDFQAGPGIVNAWYQPEYNSITLSAGMLQPPFFHQNFPAAVNYGGIGIVSGHELTHGFDDQGVQWGPTGNLDSWMDLNSTDGFNKMAQCVINEYNNFCPLDASQYTPNCVNGEQTQGENIADNGGIHSSFRAYRTHIALDGPDPALDDQIFGQFTSDQLFFLNYGQIWCQKKPADASVYKQLMVDPHSPALYRVWGTIQNFPAFRVAYNCPVGTQYTPADHCRVWVPNFEA